MIDIHSHILPGLDDGASTIADSILMARAALNDGISHVLATPHHANGRYLNGALSVKEAVEDLIRVLQEQQIPLRVLPGSEIRVYKNLIEDMERGSILTLNDSRYALIEFPADRIPEHMEEYIHELRVIGKVAIIAHPERNQEIMRNPERLAHLIGLGALSQITAGSVNGHFGKKIRSFAMQLCSEHLTHFIASDAHNILDRPFGLLHSYRAIADSLGDKYVEYYQTNARNLIHNDKITVWEPVIRKPTWISKVFKRTTN
jgi:protein-tyrosine phosphatase